MDALFAAVADQVLESAKDLEPQQAPATLTWNQIGILKEPRDNAQGIAHFFDIVENADGPFDYVDLQSKMVPAEGEQNLRGLPSAVGMKVFSPKTAEVQIAIVRTPDGGPNKFTIIKWYHIRSKVLGHAAVNIWSF